MSQLHLSGSCLCGSVSYEISGEPHQFWHCHCERCRKATGTGHATNIIIKADTVNWTAGEELLGHYEVPEAKRFATAFCTNCGSLMPRFTPNHPFGVVPAGSLDTDPGILPRGRIYQDSRAAWSCDGTELPGYETYPET